MIAGDVIRRARGDRGKGREEEDMSRVTIMGDRAQLPGGMKGESRSVSIFSPASGAYSADAFLTRNRSGNHWRILEIGLARMVGIES
jgi:hypothetical protein